MNHKQGNEGETLNQMLLAGFCLPQESSVWAGYLSGKGPGFSVYKVTWGQTLGLIHYYNPVLGTVSGYKKPQNQTNTNNLNDWHHSRVEKDGHKSPPCVRGSPFSDLCSEVAYCSEIGWEENLSAWIAWASCAHEGLQAFRLVYLLEKRKALAFRFKY